MPHIHGKAFLLFMEANSGGNQEVCDDYTMEENILILSLMIAHVGSGGIDTV